VRVLVSGWIPFTDMPVGAAARQQALAADAQRTQEGVRQALSAAGGGGSVRRYKYLPIADVTASARAVRALQSANPRARIALDGERGLMLHDSTRIVGAADGWQRGLTGKGELVAVLDGGVDTAHPFLAGKVVQEACFSARCPNGKDSMVGPGAARPLTTHGTHVAGIIAGHSAKLSGVAPEAGLIAVQVFSTRGDHVSASDHDVLAGLDYIVQLAVERHLPIASVNLSLGGGGYAAPCGDSVFEATARTLLQAGVIVVAAAGNDGRADKLGEPACAPHIVSVGAVDKQGAIAEFSDSAPFLTVLAPGVGILSSMGAPGPITYATDDGTSMAAPHVAAAFALLRQAMPEAAPEDLIRRLLADAPRVTDPRNGVRTPVLRIPANLVVGKPAPPAPAPTKPSPEQPLPEPPPPPPVAAPAPAPAQPGWTAITQ
jgi:subtilisin family serine protease